MITFEATGTASTGPNDVSVYPVTATVWAAAAYSPSGTCFYIRDDTATGTTYGSGTEPCTGAEAETQATEAPW